MRTIQQQTSVNIGFSRLDNGWKSCWDHQIGVLKVLLCSSGEGRTFIHRGQMVSFGRPVEPDCWQVWWGRDTLKRSWRLWSQSAIQLCWSKSMEIKDWMGQTIKHLPPMIKSSGFLFNRILNKPQFLAPAIPSVDNLRIHFALRSDNSYKLHQRPPSWHVHKKTQSGSILLVWTSSTKALKETLGA